MCSMMCIKIYKQLKMARNSGKSKCLEDSISTKLSVAPGAPDV